MMKKRKYIMLALMLVFTFMSCDEDENLNTIPAEPVSFEINFLNAKDKNLRSPANMEVYTSSRLATDRIGFSGLLVVCSAIPITATTYQLYAYDLCCPHEKRRDIRVQPQKDGSVKCPQCGSIFDVFSGGETIGLGYLKSGPSKDNLQVYVARHSNSKDGVFTINRIKN